VGNGDPNCHELDKAPTRSLFNGLAQAIMQATKKPGTITVEASAEGLPATTLAITSKQVVFRPSL